MVHAVAHACAQQQLHNTFIWSRFPFDWCECCHLKQAQADIHAWVPQAGAVSGKAHYMHTLTGEVSEEHPHQERINAMVAAVRGEIDAQQVPCLPPTASMLDQVSDYKLYAAGALRMSKPIF